MGTDATASHRLGNGSAIAWLAHLDLLQRIVDESLETSLVVEDDADWDVALKDQMQDLAEGIHRLGTSGKVKSRSPWNISGVSPYGHDWDILWIGHCGEDVGPAVKSLRHGTNVPLEIWHDSTAIPQNSYVGWAKNSVLALPAFSRCLQPAEGPVCSFGYGVTHEGAKKVITLASKGTAEAFDVKLASLCLDGSLGCLTVTPELIHHHVLLTGKIGEITSEVNAANGQGTIVHEDDLSMQDAIGTTANIVRSARCRALYGRTCPPHS